jgi:hypothetical protein
MYCHKEYYLVLQRDFEVLVIPSGTERSGLESRNLHFRRQNYPQRFLDSLWSLGMTQTSEISL